MSQPYVMKYIAEGEHQQQDFKMRIDDARKIARTLAAFANTDGGRLLVGVKDNGQISGINPDEEYHMLEAAANTHCTPAVSFTTQLWRVEYRNVLEVNIAPSVLKPHMATDDEGRLRAYLRHADQVLPAPAVLTEVWRHKQNDRPLKYTHTPREKKIFNLLEQQPGLSLSQLARLSGIQRNALISIMARLVRWELASIHFEQAQARFTLR